MSSSPISSSSTDPVAAPYLGMLDVPCQVDVIVGHGSITVRECLKLRRDSIIRLNQPAGADLQVRVHGIPAATGEIVVDDETTSVRISEILPPPGIEGGQS
jgi:flagellar motor switch/type III secretory pathway protein FliN